MGDKKAKNVSSLLGWDSGFWGRGCTPLWVSVLTGLGVGGGGLAPGDLGAVSARGLGCRWGCVGLGLHRLIWVGGR